MNFSHPVTQISLVVCLMLLGGIFSTAFARENRSKFFGFFAIIASLIAIYLSLTARDVQSMVVFELFSFSFQLLNRLFLFISGSGIFFFALYNMGLGRVERAKEQDSRYYNLAISIFASSMLIIPTLNFWGKLNYALGFLTIWETMSISSFLLMIFSGKEPRLREKALIYLIAMHVSALFLMIGFFSIDYNSSSLLGLILLFIGFGIKIGIFPGHFWMADGYDALPGGSAALTAGVMVNMGVYGIVSIMSAFMEVEDVNIQQTIFGYVLLLVGLFSALYGVVWALVQRKMKKVLAASSMENMGLLVLALGITILTTTYVASWRLIMTFAMLGFIIHTFNHSILKALLFYGVDMVKNATGESNLNLLGGMSKVLPHTNRGILIGAWGISTLPLINGFVGKFFIYAAAFMLMLGADTLVLKVTLMGVIIGLGVIGALSLFVFVKFYSMIFLGSCRSVFAKIDYSVENIYSVSTIYLMSFVSIILGICPLIWAVLQQHDGTYFILLWLTVLNIVILVILLLLFVIRKCLLRKRVVTCALTWGCGYEKYNSKMEYTSDSLSLPWVKLVDKIFIREEKPIDIKELYPVSFEHRYAHRELIRDKFFAKFFKYLLSKFAKLECLLSGVMQSYLWISVIFFVIVLLYAIFAK